MVIFVTVLIAVQNDLNQFCVSHKLKSPVFCLLRFLIDNRSLKFKLDACSSFFLKFWNVFTSQTPQLKVNFLCKEAHKIRFSLDVQLRPYYTEPYLSTAKTKLKKKIIARRVYVLQQR